MTTVARAEYARLDPPAELVELAACPACGSGSHERLAHWSPTPDIGASIGLFPPDTPRTFRVCGSCTLVFISPRPSEGSLERYYTEVCPANEAHWAPGDAELNPRYARYERKRFQRLHRTVRRYHDAPRSVLDVGGQGGASLRPFLEAGAAGYVVDPGFATYASEAGHLSGFASLDDLLAHDVRVDCAFSLQTFEHLFAPARELTKIVRALAPDALVLIEVPLDLLHYDSLLDGPAAPLLGELHAEHLNYWSPSSLEALARCCGLDVLHIAPMLQIARWGGAIPSLTLVARRASVSSAAPARLRSELPRIRRRIRVLQRQEALRARLEELVTRPLARARAVWRRR
jgi:SAM-dependent methyltransferase